MEILIVSGGSIDRAFALDFLKKNTFDHTIAVDQGAAFCKDAGLRPEILVGDFDTLAEETLRWFEASGTVIERYRPEKDDTDIEIALRTASECWNRVLSEDEKRRITILGGTGTRLDHMLGTLYCMAGLDPEIGCQIVDVHNRVRILHPGTYRLDRAKSFGPYLSLLPLGGDAKGITLRGVKYPLTEHTMTCFNSLGISNEIIEETAMISFREGILVCLETRD